MPACGQGLLPNGRVLVSGGANWSIVFGSARLYFPASDAWGVTGTLAVARTKHTSTLLPNGQVLVTGGIGGGGSNMQLASAALNDPSTGLWSATGSLAAGRYAHTATLLSNGKVLVAGGVGPGGAVSSSTELYDPATGAWTSAGNLAATR